MTKRFAAIFIILLAVALASCGCIPTPFAEQTIESGGKSNIPSGEPTRKIYVSGAVIHDGYLTLPQICDYKTLLEKAGVTAYTAIPIDGLSSAIPEALDSVIFGFVLNGVTYPCVNVNGAAVKLRLEIDGVDEYVVDKLADYVELNGKITNRDSLALALGDDYDGNYYKFYIDIDDYE